MSGPSDPVAPVADAELPALFGILHRFESVGVAVSGGPDSTALLLLLHRFATRHGRLALRVLTVDHGLRPEASIECRDVVGFAERLGLPATLLTWNHGGSEPPQADLQAAARSARFALLAGAARDHGLQAIALGHTLDDQAETFLMRLSRGSGVWGLAGMPAQRTVGGVSFVRPLLRMPKSRLLATCEAAGVPYVTDPSNRADRFLRVRTRRVIPLLADIGIDATRLAETADRLARAAEALGVMVSDLRRNAAVDLGGAYLVDLERLRAAPAEIGLRLLADLIRTVRPGVYPPRAAPLEAWWQDLDPGLPARRTIAGVVLDARKAGLWIYAEAGRKGFSELLIRDPGTFLWDGRFTVEVTTSPKMGVMVRAARGTERRADLPAAVAASLPVALDMDTKTVAEGVRVTPLGLPDFPA